MVTRGKEKGGINWEMETGYIHTTMYKADDLYKNLLCSTGNSTQNSVMAFMGKESKKEQRVT